VKYAVLPNGKGSKENMAVVQQLSKLQFHAAAPHKFKVARYFYYGIKIVI
jgi:hypothetical protein